MLKLGVRMVQLLGYRPTTKTAIQPGLDFSNPANSGYRGYYF